jgi:hypothetical protein
MATNHWSPLSPRVAGWVLMVSSAASSSTTPGSVETSSLNTRINCGGDTARTSFGFGEESSVICGIAQARGGATMRTATTAVSSMLKARFHDIRLLTVLARLR